MRWPHLNAQAREDTVGQLVNDAMAGGERDNQAPKGVLPKDCTRPALDEQRLGQLIDLISKIQVGVEVSHAKDELGRVDEHLLSRFPVAEGEKGGEGLATLEPIRADTSTHQALAQDLGGGETPGL